MKTIRALALGAAVIAALLFATSAHAVTVSDCQTLIEAIQSDLANVSIGGNNPELTRASLNSKLSGAMVKLDQGKFCDAITKITEFRSAVLAMAVPNAKGKTKMAPDDANRLALAADAFLLCIQEFLPPGANCP